MDYTIPETLESPVIRIVMTPTDEDANAFVLEVSGLYGPAASLILLRNLATYITTETGTVCDGTGVNFDCSVTIWPQMDGTVKWQSVGVSRECGVSRAAVAISEHSRALIEAMALSQAAHEALAAEGAQQKVILATPGDIPNLERTFNA